MVVKASSAGDTVVEVVVVVFFVVVVGFAVAAVVKGTFWTTGFVGRFGVVVVTTGFFVIGSGFFVVAFGGEMLIWIRSLSARVDTGRRVVVVVVGTVAFDLIWFCKTGGNLCGKIGSWRGTEGLFVPGVLRGGNLVVEVTNGYFVVTGLLVITGMGLRETVGAVGRLVVVVVITAVW